MNAGERCGLCGEVGRFGKPGVSEDGERWRVESGKEKCVIVGRREGGRRSEGVGWRRSEDNGEGWKSAVQPEK